jgi:hypothetical protein
MRKRPLSITIIGWLFIAVGTIALGYHLMPQHGKFEPNLVWVCAIRLLAIICGAFMMHGLNWARWLLVLWVAYHIILSALHSVSEALVHSLLFGLIAFFFFRPQASVYFRSPGANTARVLEAETESTKSDSSQNTAS